jgi:hypothetical protein
MKRFASLVCAVLSTLAVAEVAQADTSSLHYGGYQPWWNIFAKRNHGMTAEEKRLQRFWHDYYDALRHYYQALDHIDWVAYYKNHGYQINGGGSYGGPGCGSPGYGQCGGTQHIQFAPVFVSPPAPSGCASGPAMGPSAPGMGAFYGYGQ